MSQPASPDQRPKCCQCNKKPINVEFRPFCSKRCADLDLGKWLNEGYAIPGAPLDTADDVPTAKDLGED